MSPARLTFLLILTLCAASAWSQTVNRFPHIGYAYPAGGQRGTVVRVYIGGQYLNGIKEVYVSGEGVSGKITHFVRPVFNLQKEERQEIQNRMKARRDELLLNSDLPEHLKKGILAKSKQKEMQMQAMMQERAKDSKQPEPEDTTPVKLPDHPMLEEIESMSLRELAHMTNVLFFDRTKMQQNRQLAELSVVEITIDPGAELGDRELRLGTTTSLTNPLVFQVGDLPEYHELEPNEPGKLEVAVSNALKKGAPISPKVLEGHSLLKELPLETPVALNGQIRPGDIDRFKFKARKGEQIVIETHARRLIPYLADAVPGWFQATLALYDDKGNELAYEDDYRFNPDPVLFYKIPKDGVYELEIHDSIYRGREDFVYRIAVGELPFVTGMYPLGGREGEKVNAWIDGWNLPGNKLTLNTEPGPDRIRQTALNGGGRQSNDVVYGVGAIPECEEDEPNNDIKHAHKIKMPQIVNGYIAKPGDVDVFRIDGNKGDKVVAEVFGRRLNSPVDSVLKLTDAKGNVVEWNDDFSPKEKHLHTGMGLVTHHADSYLTATLPKKGKYYVRMADAQNKGGAIYGYRLRLSEPQPDFALRVTPSSLNIQPGMAAAITLHADRKDGFNGPIYISLKDAPPGFKLSGAEIPKGRDRIQMTLSAPEKSSGIPLVLQMMGSAKIGGESIRRAVEPADDTMQAFLYRHLAPAQELVVMVKKTKFRKRAFKLATFGMVRVPKGSSVKAQIKTPNLSMFKNIKLELNNPPEGMSIEDVTIASDGIVFQIAADEKKALAGLTDNLIVEATAEWKNSKNKKGAPPKRISLGALPAIPIRIVEF